MFLISNKKLLLISSLFLIVLTPMIFGNWFSELFGFGDDAAVIENEFIVFDKEIIKGNYEIKEIKSTGLTKYFVINKSAQIDNDTLFLGLGINSTRILWARDTVENPTIEDCYQAEPIIQEDYHEFDCGIAEHRQLLLTRLTNYVSKGMRIIKNGQEQGYINYTGDMVIIQYPLSELSSDNIIEIGEDSVYVRIVNLNTNSILSNVTYEPGNFTHLTFDDTGIYNSSNASTIYFTFDDNTSTTLAYDYGVGGIDGTYNGNTEIVANGDLFGNGLRTYGQTAQDYMVFADAGEFDGANEYTVSFWFKSNKENGSMLFEGGDAGDRSPWIYSEEPAAQLTSKISMRMGTTDSTADCNIVGGAGTSYENGVWKHFLLTWNGTHCFSYVNGIEIGSDTTTSKEKITTPWYRVGDGQYLSNRGNANGTFDEVMMGAFYLESSEVMDLYNNQSTRFISNGFQNFNNTNVSADGTENVLNVTFEFQNLLGSNLSVSVNATDYYNATRINDTHGRVTYLWFDAIDGDDLNITVQFHPSDDSFYSPLLLGDIEIDSWTEAAGPAPDTTYPSFSGYTEYLNNNSVYVLGQTYQFNVTITDTNGTAGLEFNGVNYTASNESDEYYVTLPSDLAVDNYLYYWWGYGSGSDTLYNSSEVRDYAVQIATTDCSLIAGNSTYPDQVQFNYSCNQNQATQTVYRNGTDVTSDNSTFVTEGAGDYNLTLDVDLSENYTALSIEVLQKISQYSTTCTLSTNTPVTYPEQVQSNLSCDNQEQSEVLFRDDVVVTGENDTFVSLGFGSYEYVGNVSATQNYTSSTDSETVIVNINADNCNVLFNDTSPITYGEEILVWTNCGDSFSLTRNGTTISNNSVQSLASGGYNFSVERTDTYNYSNFYDIEEMIVDKATGSVTLSFNDTSPITFPETFTASCTVDSGEVSAVLRENGTIITSGTDRENGAGDWFYNCSLTESQNYTYSEDIDTFLINKGTQILNIELNTSTSIINETSTIINGTGNMTSATLYFDDTIVDNPYEVTPDVGSYEIVFNSTGNANWSEAITSITLTVSSPTSTIKKYEFRIENDPYLQITTSIFNITTPELCFADSCISSWSEINLTSSSSDVDYSKVQNYSNSGCPNNYYAYNRLQNGTWLCREDQTGGAGGVNYWLINSGELAVNTTTTGGIENVNLSANLSVKDTIFLGDLQWTVYENGSWEIS